MHTSTTLRRWFGGILPFSRNPTPSAPSAGPARPVSVSDSTVTTTAPPERRQSPRRWGNPIQVVLQDGRRAEPARGWVANRSAGGLGLSFAEPLSAGLRVQVRISVAPESMPSVDLEVIHCQALTGRWLAGCRFLTPPPADVLLMFR
jgi:hypothetical protein